MELVDVVRMVVVDGFGMLIIILLGLGLDFIARSRSDLYLYAFPTRLATLIPSEVAEIDIILKK